VYATMRANVLESTKGKQKPSQELHSTDQRTIRELDNNDY